MLTVLAILIALAAVGAVFIVPSPEGKKTPTVVEHHHHHHTTVIERPVYVQAQVFLIKAEIALAEAKKEPEPVRLPEARLLLNPTTAIERYRSHERKPS